VDLKVDRRHAAERKRMSFARSIPVRFGWHVPLSLLSCLAVYAVSTVALAQPGNVRTLEVAVTLDLTLFVPALYWFLLVRHRSWPAYSLLPVFLVCLVLAAMMLPAGRQSTLRFIRYLAAPAELALLIVLIRRATRAVRAARAQRSSDVLERIRTSVATAIPEPHAAQIIAFETAVFWYAFFSWRIRPPATGDAADFSYHRKTGYGAVVVALLLAIAAEIVPIHATLARANGTLAWVVTALSLYGAVWLISDFRAIRLRPIRLESDRLVIRFGLRWTLSVPLDRIDQTRPIGASANAVPADLRLALPGARRISIQLNQPVVAIGIYGLQRDVMAIELGVDEPDRLLRALTTGPAREPDIGHQPQ
jgi:hypothetical protein